MTEDSRDGPDAEIARRIIAALRAQARVTLIMIALAVLTFVFFAADAGRPAWLVAIIGLFGAILIAFFVALVWFWLRFFSHFGRKS